MYSFSVLGYLYWYVADRRLRMHINIVTNVLSNFNAGYYLVNTSGSYYKNHFVVLLPMYISPSSPEACEEESNTADDFSLTDVLEIMWYVPIAHISGT